MTGSGANGEDLDVVLGRFQSWAAKRTKSSPPDLKEKPSTKKSTSGNATIQSSDVREVSYDQALRASRYRRHEDIFSVDPVPEAASSIGSGRPVVEHSAHEDLPRSRRWSVDDDLELGPQLSRWPEVSFTKAISAADLPANPGRASTVSDPLAEPAPILRSIEMPAPAAPSTDAVVAKRAVVSKQGSSSWPANQEQNNSPTGSAFEATGESGSPYFHGSRSENAFSEVLKRTAAVTPPASARSVCLTLQAADGERARLQQSTAKASLSAAVYVRQCAIGIDDLRIQIEIALSRARREQQNKCKTMPGILPDRLRQFGARCWRRLRRSDDKFVEL